MEAKEFMLLLESHSACPDAREWAKGKTWKEVHATCYRGDWLLWLFKRTNPAKIREITLAKGHCANLARQWMKDNRSTDAVDMAIRFGEGNATGEELADAAYAAAAAAARKESLQKSTDICRKYLPIEIWGDIMLEAE